MDAVTKHTVITEDGKVTVGGLPYRRGDRVQVIVVKQGGLGRGRETTARDLLESGLVGIWADREDITDSSEFARQLREKAQTRGDRQ